jgi:hypothetical protein
MMMMMMMMILILLLIILIAEKHNRNTGKQITNNFCFLVHKLHVLLSEQTCLKRCRPFLFTKMGQNTRKQKKTNGEPGVN